MKVQVVSDLHLEFGSIVIENAGADVLILSGDICVANDLLPHETFNIMGEPSKSDQYHTFFQGCCERFNHVVYVAGNHEHYHGDYATSIPHIKECLSYLPNLHILDKEMVEIEGVVFVGGTLWTDMNDEDPQTLYTIRGCMNDFRIVKNSNNKTLFTKAVYAEGADGIPDYNTIVSYRIAERTATLLPEDVVQEHKFTLKYIHEVIEAHNDRSFVVVGHHAPSKLSTKPQYEEDHLMNGGYSSDLSNFILDHPQIKLWTHGHTHNNFDYHIGSTRVVCNPRGYYRYHENDEFNPTMVFDV